eukprot:5250319-Pleurochrysis_carterae.AAC.2
MYVVQPHSACSRFGRAFGCADVAPSHRAVARCAALVASRENQLTCVTSEFASARSPRRAGTMSDRSGTPRLPPLTPRAAREAESPRLTLASSREVEVRKLQMSSLKPRIGAAGRIGVLPAASGLACPPDAPIQRTQTFTRSLGPPEKQRKSLTAEEREEELAALHAQQASR